MCGAYYPSVSQEKRLVYGYALYVYLEAINTHIYPSSLSLCAMCYCMPRILDMAIYYTRTRGAKGCLGILLLHLNLMEISKADRRFFTRGNYPSIPIYWFTWTPLSLSLILGIFFFLKIYFLCLLPHRYVASGERAIWCIKMCVMSLLEIFIVCGSRDGFLINFTIERNIVTVFIG